MATAIEEFEQACTNAGVDPVEACVKAGLHRSTWFRWKAAAVSPTIRNLDAAKTALQGLADRGAAAA
jgi:hypothetical protein